MIREPRGLCPLNTQRTLFYPLSADANDSNLAAQIALFPIILALILFALFSPLVLLLIPVAWIHCRRNKVPFLPIITDPQGEGLRIIEHLENTH